MNLLITGATGFVGTALCSQLAARSRFADPMGQVYAVVRSPRQLNNYFSQPIQPLVLSSLSELSHGELLAQTDCIVHLAARVHQMNDSVADPLEAFRSVNTQATYLLAEAAAKAGVRRFIYLSSIKVNGEGRPDRLPYRETDLANPVDPYGQSKWEAETLLRQLAQETNLEVVILRPPLVYGPEVKANFLQLIQTVDRGIPLPFGQIRNARSMVFVSNLVDAILTCLDHPQAANQTFLVSDGADFSTPDLIRQLAHALHRPARLLPVPPLLLRLLGNLTGKTAAIDRLLGSLTVDSSKIQTLLDWTPPFTPEQGFQATADWYIQTKL